LLIETGIKHRFGNKLKETEHDEKVLNFQKQKEKLTADIAMTEGHLALDNFLSEKHVESELLAQRPAALGII
jgi:hypothetical protein